MLLINIGKRSAKFPDSPIFTGERDLEFEAWYFNMWDKLAINEDHFDTDKAKTVYVIGCIKGMA